jgi:hypothetical protein
MRAAVETMPLVKAPVLWSPGSPLQFQHPHPGIVVVQHLSIRRLPDQLVPRRPDHLGFFFRDFPLRRRRQRIPSCASSRSRLKEQDVGD